MMLLQFHPYCGMTGLPFYYTDLADARKAAAARIRRAKNDRDQPVSVLDKGHQWELGEPEGCMMVPDFAGILTLTEVRDADQDDEEA